MVSNPQALAKLLGDGGCCFLSTLRVADDYMPQENVLEVFEWANTVKLSSGSLLVQPDGYVNDLAELLSRTSGRAWTCTKEAIGYILKPGEREIVRWERPTPSMIYTHFVATLLDGSVWDPIGKSQTVALGRPQSKRVWRPA
jgi:hypothetical protein